MCRSLTKTGQSRHSGFPNVECRTTEDAAGTDTNRPVIMGGGYFNPMLHDLLPAHGAPETRAPVYINRGESPGSEAFEGASLASKYLIELLKDIFLLYSCLSLLSIYNRRNR